MAIKTQQRVSMRTIALKPALASAGISLRALPVGSGHALLGGALGHPQVIVALGEGTGGQRRRRRLPARVIVHHNVRRDLLHLRSCGPFEGPSKPCKHCDPPWPGSPPPILYHEWRNLGKLVSANEFPQVFRDKYGQKYGHPSRDSPPLSGVRSRGMWRGAHTWAGIGGGGSMNMRWRLMKQI